jgi:hypothetical protein
VSAVVLQVLRGFGKGKNFISKRMQMDQKEYPQLPTWSQKENKLMPNDATSAPKSSLGAFDILVSLR